MQYHLCISVLLMLCCRASKLNESVKQQGVCHSMCVRVCVCVHARACVYVCVSVHCKESCFLFCYGKLQSTANKKRYPSVVVMI